MNNSSVSLQSIKEKHIPRLLATRTLHNVHLELAIIVEHIAKITRASYLSASGCPDDISICPEHATQIATLVEKRISGVPSAYLIGQKEFYSRNFKVSPHVLIPRPETEILVDICLNIIAKRVSTTDKIQQTAMPTLFADSTDTCLQNLPCTIIDCGTGSGCIGLSLAKELKKNSTLQNWKIILSDISKKALACAKENAEILMGKEMLAKHLASKTLQFVHSNLLENIFSHIDNIGIIVANLPYIASKDLRSNVLSTLSYEPSLALEGILRYEGTDNNAQKKYADGSALIEILFEQAKQISNSHIIILEIDPPQVDRIMRLASDFGYTQVTIQTDYRGCPRVVCCAKC